MCFDDYLIIFCDGEQIEESEQRNWVNYFKFKNLRGYDFEI